MGDKWEDLPPEPPPPAPGPEEPHEPRPTPKPRPKPTELGPSGEPFGDLITGASEIAGSPEAKAGTTSAPPPAPLPGEGIADDVAGMVGGKGCGQKMAGLVMAVVIMIVLLIIFAALNKNNDPNGDASSKTKTSTSDDAVTSSSEAEKPKEKPAPAGAPAPSAGDLSDTEVLFKGTGGPIGPIANDGKSRYLALDKPGISVGTPPAGYVMTESGGITSFGATLHTATNQGRYGIAVFEPSTQKYLAGCAIEIGQTSCQVKYPKGIAVKKGQSLVVIVGEAGNLVEKGDFDLDWWFVFQQKA